MPLDGATLSGVVYELNHALVGGRIDKITQPEADEIIINLRNAGVNYKLLLTANASAPRVHLTRQSKPGPMQAPVFCMVLRKHISGGRLLAIHQPSFERIVTFDIENRTEMGDMARKKLVIEIMGKHSNILLLDANEKVLDAVKHVPPSVSAVRTILPGVSYAQPPGKNKTNPLEAHGLDFSTPPGTFIQQAIFTRYNGFSPLLASEICARAGVHPETLTENLNPTQQGQLNDAFLDVCKKIKNGAYAPHIYVEQQGKALDITPWPFLLYSDLQGNPQENTSDMLEFFYVKRDADYRLLQKTTDLRKVLATLLERCRKKAFAHEKSMAETEERDIFRIKGELLTANLYQITRGETEFEAKNFYDENKPIKIALDPTLTPSENAQKYFIKYNKQKRAAVALQTQMAQNKEDILYLESVTAALQNVSGEEDVTEIRTELAQQGFIKRRNDRTKKGKERPAKPLHYTSSDGYDIYVGKNNTQNDQLTLKTARNTDLWLHTKDIPGSHVILMTKNEEVPEGTLLEAANLAAYHSRARASANVPVDYVARKHVRKPAGAKPGFVIYEHHKTVYITPQEPQLLTV